MSVETKDLFVSYRRDLEILHGISILADKGTIVCVIGPNGSGKSTLLKTIYGYLKPRRGNVSFNGEDITGIQPHSLPSRGMCFIPQHHTIFALHTVEENLQLGTYSFRKDKARVTESIDAFYERLPFMKEKRKDMAGKLSGGQQRMLEIGRALMTNPRAILIDEPTAGLAPMVAEEIYTLLADLRKERITMIIVEQNVRKGVAASDYVYVLKDGRVDLSGSKQQFDKELSTFIRDWLV